MPLPPVPTVAAQLRQMQQRLPSPQTRLLLRVPLLAPLLVLVTEAVIRDYRLFMLTV